MTYVGFLKWTTLMYWHHTGPFYEIFYYLLKVSIIMKAYMVQTYGIRW